MTITQTSNKSLIEISVGTEPGTWGPYVNATTGILDNILGSVATIPLTNSNVLLSSAQYQCGSLSFTGTLTANVGVILPSIGSFYNVQNLTTNSSVYSVVLTTTAAGGQQIGVPPNENINVMTDGSNVKFRNLAPIGTYLDIASNTIPNWILACTVPPYLYCNGTTFVSSTLYPVLFDMLSPQTIVPFGRGRTRFNQDDGAGVLASSQIGGQSPNLLIWPFGDQNATGGNSNFSFGQFIIGPFGVSGEYSIIPNNTPANQPNIPPLIVSGITMIRAG